MLNCGYGFSMDGALVGGRGGLIFAFVFAYHMSNTCFLLKMATH